MITTHLYKLNTYKTEENTQLSYSYLIVSSPRTHKDYSVEPLGHTSLSVEGRSPALKGLKMPSVNKCDD